MDFNDYSLATILYRKGREFDAKDFGRVISIEYYSNTLDLIKAKIMFTYISAKKHKKKYYTYDFVISNGTHKVFYNVPVDISRIHSISLNIHDYESEDDRYILRIDDIHFE